MLTHNLQFLCHFSGDLVLGYETDTALSCYTSLVRNLAQDGLFLLLQCLGPHLGWHGYLEMAGMFTGGCMSGAVALA